MKYPFIVAFIILLTAGCKKPNCIQCEKQVKASAQTTTVTTAYNIVPLQFCGAQADSALAVDSATYTAFQNEQGFVPYSCFYKY